MEPLSGMSCEACRPGSPPVSAEERARLLPQIRDWRIVEHDGVEQLERTFAFDDFVQALAFTNAVGVMAEAQDHHPAILIEYGRVTVRWWTHAIRGLHRNDFIMAARTDRASGRASCPEELS